MRLMPTALIGVLLAGAAPGAGAPSRAAGLYSVELPPPATLQMTGDNAVFAAAGVLSPGSQETRSFVLPKLARIEGLLMGEGVSWSFRAPNGERLVPGTTPNRAGRESFGGGGLAGFALDDPEKGTWTVVTTSQADTAVSYAIMVTSAGPAEENAHLELRKPGHDPRLAMVAKPGDPLYVRTFVARKGVVVTGTRWVVGARTPRDSIISVPVYDDGKHADGKAGDGVFVGAIVTEGPDGAYQVFAEAQMPGGGRYIVSESAEIQTKNDLVMADSILVSPKVATAGKPVTLTVTVMNDGADEFKSVPLELYVDGAKLSEKRVGLKPGEPLRVETAWVPPKAGSYEVKLILSSYDEPSWSDLTNSHRTTIVRVR